MNKKSILRGAIDGIQPNKPRFVQKKQAFTPPSPIFQGETTHGTQTEGNLPQVEQTQVDSPQGDLTQGSPTRSELPQVQCTHVNATQVQDTQVNQTRVQSTETRDTEVRSTHVKSPQLDPLAHYYDDQRRTRREKMVVDAVKLGGSLAPEVQESLVKLHLAEGWGRLSHTVTRFLKAPTRHGLKLVDLALILTIYDRTIAQVNPKMFAPITAQEFESETGMDQSNVRAALRELVKKEIVTKIPYKTLNFWGLNSDYFQRTTGVPLPHGKQTQGDLTQVNAPDRLQGKLPQVEVGQSNPPLPASSARNNSEKSPSKNLKKESEEESLSCENQFPNDMMLRWNSFKAVGKFSNTEKEKEIFKELLITYGIDFASLCGRVVSFLEEHGNGKAGDEGKVYNPMGYLRGHWEHNLGRYKAWQEKKDAARIAQEKRTLADAEDKKKAEEDAKEIAKQRMVQAEQDSQIQAQIQRLLNAYPTEDAFISFAQQIVEQSRCEFTLNSWKKQGWESPLVKNCVISHFLKAERAQLEITA